MARPDFRSQAAQRLASERSEYTPALIDLLTPADPSTVTDVRRVPLDHVHPNPDQPRQHFDEEALQDLAASIREHGVLQPVLVRPRPDGDFQIVAGERRWRAAHLAGLEKLPVIVEHIDDEAALEIAIIENLQREDISPLEEADMFERMTSEHGYSLRKLATKLGKDKGYVENRLRIARAPQEIRELVAERSDTLSHAYELMKVDDPRKRRRLARQVAAGELSLVKLRQRIEGRPHPEPQAGDADQAAGEIPAGDVALGGIGADAAGEIPADAVVDHAAGEIPADAADPDRIAADEARTARPAYVAVPVVPDGPPPGAVDIDQASEHLTSAINELAAALLSDPALAEASHAERQQFAKYLTITKIKLENAIAVVRSGEPREPSLSAEAHLPVGVDGSGE